MTLAEKHGTEAELFLLFHINKQKDKYVCIHEIMRLIIMKMKMKMKNASHRYDINRPRSRHGPAFTQI